MSRPLRIQFPGAFYHVMARGNRKMNLYLSDDDKHNFLNLLKKVVQKFNFVIHAFVLMDNHYHLLLETPLANLSKGMHYLNSVYSQGFNKKHQMVGHLTQGRFKAILVDKNSYYETLIYYIHNNPVKANIVKDPSDYWASSHQAIIKTYYRNRWAEWYDSEIILSHFHTQKENALKIYKHRLKNTHPNDLSKLIDKKTYILGEENYHQEIFEKYIKPKIKINSIKDGLRSNLALAIKEIINMIERDMMKSSAKENNLKLIQKMSLYYLTQNSDLSYSEIADFMNIGSSDAARMKQKRFAKIMKENSLIKKQYTKFCNHVQKKFVVRG